eukprot:1225557-Amphidinium_carterae.1
MRALTLDCRQILQPLPLNPVIKWLVAVVNARQSATWTSGKRNVLLLTCSIPRESNQIALDHKLNATLTTTLVPPPVVLGTCWPVFAGMVGLVWKHRLASLCPVHVVWKEYV